MMESMYWEAVLFFPQDSTNKSESTYDIGKSKVPAQTLRDGGCVGMERNQWIFLVEEHP